MIDWQPFATAPRPQGDGPIDNILVLIGGQAIEAFWDRWSARSDRHKWRPIQLDSHGCGCCGGSDPAPTHWAPLNRP